MRAWVERARKGQARPVLAEPTREECLAYCRGASDRIRSLVESQHSSGAWVRPRGGAGSWGAQTYPRDTNAVEVLRYVERARMALGELPLERRGDCDPLASAYPGADWYETPLRRAGN
jgi:hypothetical protein